jgi:hypothetical protein
MSATEKAYEAVQTHLIERDVLSQYGMTLREFKDDGLNKMGLAVHHEIVNEIRQLTNRMRYEQPTNLLVCGFDGGLPEMFSSDGAGSCTRQGYSFHAIGAGSNAAIGWLMAHDDFRLSGDVAEIAYRLCEAKFASEHAPGVGDEVTLLTTLYMDGTSDMMVIEMPSRSVNPTFERADKLTTSEQEMLQRDGFVFALPVGEVIRSAWEERRRQALPKKALAAIRDGLPNTMSRLKQLEEITAAQRLALTPPPSFDPPQKENPGVSTVVSDKGRHR